MGEMWNKDNEQYGEKPQYEDHIEKIVHPVTNSLKRYSKMPLPMLLSTPHPLFCPKVETLRCNGKMGWN